MNTGQEFVKKIGPFGSVMFLLVFVCFLIICFMPPKTAADDYTAPQNSEYYAQNDETLGELKTELEDNFFPLLDLTPSLNVSDGKIVIELSEDDAYTARLALKKHFDMKLFVFEED